MEEKKADAELDLRGEVCPMTFVKTKIKLEELKTGQKLEVTLPAGESMRSVPISVKEEGHKIIKVQKDDEKTFRLTIEKG
jgi:tRNA 2-thiouridine synthesizing protein A